MERYQTMRRNTCPKPQHKLNKDLVSFATCDCIPHVPIAQFMREGFLSRSQVFTLAKNRYLSMTQIKSRYFVSMLPGYTLEKLYDDLDYGC